MAKDVLKQLGINAINPGAWSAGCRWIENEDAPLLESHNPATGKLLAKVQITTENEYERIMKDAQTAFLEWRAIPAPKRGEVIRQIGEEIRNKHDALGKLVTLETGKILSEGMGEVQEMIDMADFCVGQSRMLYGLSMHSERSQHRMYEQWHPLGIAGVISAFNFPMAVWAWNAFNAAICGDVVVWKPSPKTPLCAIAVQNICNEVLESQGLPGIFMLFVTDNQALAERFVDDERVPLVSFTGSTSVGKRVAQRVASRMGRSILECSGNNAVIVEESADLEMAVEGIVFGAIGTAGQRCTTTRRLIIQETIVDEFCARLVEAYKEIRIGDPMDARTLMGPIIDQYAVAKYSSIIKAIKAEGGTILCGGKTIDAPGHYVEPTLVRVPRALSMVLQENFVPILYVQEYTTLAQAIEINNTVTQGLSSAMFTNNLRHAEQFLSEVGSDCGIANINIGTSGAEIGGAFGGEKDTGGGREAGSDAWKNYMRRQTTTINYGYGVQLSQGISFDLDG